MAHKKRRKAHWVGNGKNRRCQLGNGKFTKKSNCK